MATEDRGGRRLSWQERASLVVTNATKLAGVAVVFLEVGREEIRPMVFFTAVVMMTGAQGLEVFLAAFFGSSESSGGKR